jgi:triacylglycerol lipase
MMRTRLVSQALVVIVAALGGACGGKDDEGGSRNSIHRAAGYSISTVELDRELACEGGKEELTGDAENEPVLLIHGTTVTREQNWGWNYWGALTELGFEVCWVQLPDLAFGDIQTASEYVARAVEVMHERTGENVDLMGHSQGGLEARWVIKWFPAAAFVDDYIALATPNHGASTFDKATADGRDFEAGWQMRTDSNFLVALNRADETPGPIDYTSIYSKSDELIQPVGTQDLEGGTNILLQDLCPGRRVDHGGIAGDDVTYRLVIDALTNTGTANPDRASVKCSRDSFPGVGKPQFGPPPKGIDPHTADHEPPLEPYASG